jgi:phosphoribosyl 1,2-cyclic phosphate phosphodiesterase
VSLTLTILGCGSSGGVPRVGNDWGACDPTNPKNRRRRCSLLATRTSATGTTNLLIDTSPDLREQMLGAQVKHMDAVWLTHDHADHTHGIDDLRPFFLMGRKQVPVHADAHTGEIMRQRFGYCFQGSGGYPAIAKLHQIHYGRELQATGAGRNISALAVPVVHGDLTASCFKFGKAAYMPDVSAIGPDAMAMLAGLDLLIIDALRYKPHPSHFSLEETLAVIATLKPKRAVLTNMHIDLDYETLRRDLPKGVEPAYDGMKLEVSDAF